MKEEIYDFIFITIKVNKKISLQLLSSKYKTELGYYSIEGDYLSTILKDLIDDNKIYLDDNRQYGIAPVATKFKGYGLQKVESEKKLKEDKHIDRRFKIITIAVAIIFGVTSAVLGYLGYKLSRDSTKDKLIIDSLNKSIEVNKSTIELLGSTISHRNLTIDSLNKVISNIQSQNQGDSTERYGATL